MRSLDRAGKKEFEVKTGRVSAEVGVRGTRNNERATGTKLGGVGPGGEESARGLLRRRGDSQTHAVGPRRGGLESARADEPGAMGCGGKRGGVPEMKTGSVRENMGGPWWQDARE
eukprot:5559183-Pleurochrysis_carterae.AAC.3